MQAKVVEVNGFCYNGCKKWCMIKWTITPSYSILLGDEYVHVEYCCTNCGKTYSLFRERVVIDKEVRRARARKVVRKMPEKDKT